MESLSAAALHTAAMIARAPADRRAITRRIGCSLLEAPTGSGKTVMLAATAEAVSLHAPVVWFWFAPFAGLIAQTASALRAAAPGLRVREPARDRSEIGTRPGDVFITTWASVAARSAATRRMRVDDDTAPALDTLVAQLRAAGFLLGAVVDEAHHSFRPGTESFRFFDTVLAPDLLMAASATPDDADIEMLKRAMELRRFQHVSVSRARVVAARLNKPRVRVVSFVAHGAARELLDLNETALRKAIEQHRALKAELRRAGLPIVPLLLVQAASSDWTPARVRDLLRGPLQFAEGAVAIHTADEPDPDVQALASDPHVEVLVFKMALATGFDAPRAFTLCALRPVVDAGFGLQVVGRIMRVHPLLQTRADLPPALETGSVFLGDAQGQAGLQSAADRIKAIRDSIEVATDGVAVYEASVGTGGQIVVTGEDGQSMLLLLTRRWSCPRRGRRARCRRLVWLTRCSGGSKRRSPRHRCRPTFRAARRGLSSRNRWPIATRGAPACRCRAAVYGADAARPGRAARCAGAPCPLRPGAFRGRKPRRRRGRAAGGRSVRSRPAAAGPGAVGDQRPVRARDRA